MHLLSSRGTNFEKRIFPVIWFGVVGVLLCGSLTGIFKGNADFRSLLLPFGMAAFVFVIMKLWVWDLVDEVWDDNESLVVRNKGREVRIDLLNIKNVNHSTLSNPPRVELTLREPCAFGRTIAFVPPRKFPWIGDARVASELIERIDRRRQMVLARHAGGTLSGE
jgi:hypothetical protein